MSTEEKTPQGFKRCTGPCGRLLPRTDEYFQPCKARTADGRRNACRDCERARDAAYRRRRRAEKKAAQNAES